uniref:Uncharacterized protein n=1 Tax=Meloidogyne incognita TaxID=6306 RepID=A0A914NY37_MELIC
MRCHSKELAELLTGGGGLGYLRTKLVVIHKNKIIFLFTSASSSWCGVGLSLPVGGNALHGGARSHHDASGRCGNKREAAVFIQGMAERLNHSIPQHRGHLPNFLDSLHQEDNCLVASIWLVHVQIMRFVPN